MDEAAKTHRALLVKLKEMTDRGLSWEYQPLRPPGAWGNPHAGQYTAEDRPWRYILTRRFVGSDVEKDGIALCVWELPEGTPASHVVEFPPGSPLWAYALALWNSAEAQRNGPPVWERALAALGKSG